VVLKWLSCYWIIRRILGQAVLWITMMFAVSSTLNALPCCREQGNCRDNNCLYVRHISLRMTPLAMRMEIWRK
jgi:hypothetical protein